MSRGGFRGRGRVHLNITEVSDQHKYDVKKFMQALTEFCQNSNLNISTLKQFLFENLAPMGIRFFYEETNWGLRIMLNADRTNAKFSIPLVRSSNGLLIHIPNSQKELKEARKPELMVVSSNEFCVGQAAIDVEQFLREDIYDVYEVQDGTTVNMFWWNEDWHFSTRNSANIGSLEWRGAKYSEVLKEVFEQYPEFDKTKLNKNYTYTFGYHHPKQHIFVPSKEEKEVLGVRAWLINVFDKVAMAPVEVLPSIGIPAQKKFKVSELKLDQNIYSSLVARCERELARYLREKSNPFLGYILRTRDARANSRSDILLESSLFTEIKKCIYDVETSRQNVFARYKAKADFANMNHVILRSWLDFSKRELFFDLFPQFAEERDRYENILKQALLYLTSNLDPEDTDAILLANCLKVPLSTKVELSPPKINVMRDLALNPAYIDMYTSIFYPTRE